MKKRSWRIILLLVAIPFVALFLSVGIDFFLEIGRVVGTILRGVVSDYYC